MKAPIREQTISNFIEGYAETSTGEENLTKDLGDIFDYIEVICKQNIELENKLDYAEELINKLYESGCLDLQREKLIQDYIQNTKDTK